LKAWEWDSQAGSDFGTLGAGAMSSSSPLFCSRRLVVDEADYEYHLRARAPSSGDYRVAKDRSSASRMLSDMVIQFC
jgi:hypothetical protein